MRYVGDKDIGDALYLWEIFRDSLDDTKLQSFMEMLDVTGEQYGIGR
jgi:hypothetical protein